MGVALARLRRVRAGHTTVLRRRGDGTRAHLAARAARQRARGPAAPRSLDAIYRARSVVARLHVLHRGTHVAAVIGVRHDRPRPRLRAAAARERARRPAAPCRHVTVHWARARAARLCLAEARARRAAVLRRRGDGTRARLCAAAARRCARVPGVPRTHHAIYRARSVVARLHVLHRGTHVAAVIGVRHDRPRPRLRAAAARERARRPAAPCRHVTVHWARARAARLCLAEARARRAAVLRRRGDGTRARLCAATARRRAVAPGAPARDHTVDRAGLRLARLGFLQHRARTAVKLRIDHNGAGAALHTAAARL